MWDPAAVKNRFFENRALEMASSSVSFTWKEEGIFDARCWKMLRKMRAPPDRINATTFPLPSRTTRTNIAVCTVTFLWFTIHNSSFTAGTARSSRKQ